MLLGYITLFIIGCVGGVCNYYNYSFLENVIPLHIQNYIITVLAILIQFDNIQLLNELKNKIDETALEIQDNEINIYKLDESINIKKQQITKKG